MGKTRDLFKKIGDSTGTFHARTGTIKDRNSKDLTEAEEIKEKWQKYTEELHEKGLNDRGNQNGVVTHLEPDILECEVKNFGSTATNKASGADAIPGELFRILKDDAVKSVSLNMSANLENSAVATNWKRSVFIPVPKKGNAKECSNYHTIALISHASKVMLIILQARLQQYVN